jgi:hypothetical protein
VFFSASSYYGIVWTETTLAPEGAGIAPSRIAEFSFMPFAIFSGLGISVLVREIRMKLHGRRLDLATLAVCIFIILIFATSAVVQAYARIGYDSSYVPTQYNEYLPSFHEAYYLGNWWNRAANHTLTNNMPFTGSIALRYFVTGYGYQHWWADLGAPQVDLNNTRSRYFTAYYGFDLLQLEKPAHNDNATLTLEIASITSSQNTKVNTIFSTGRLVVLQKPSA